MGLDQYAGFRDSNGEVHEEFYWRKHARLQQFMAKMFDEQNKDKKHNTVDGFFWGQQFQEEQVNEYKAQDEKFISWCKEQLSAKKDIGYDCSW
ncbi:hypothetical protein EBR43_08460 [bacterium]|nr:hypothetical protein [bacterium]